MRPHSDRCGLGVMMHTTLVGIAVVLALGAWHLRIRRHPNWRHSGDARFYITLGYPLVGIAVFFLANAIGHTDVNWLIGMGWALLSTSLFVYGCQALNSPVPHSRGDASAAAVIRPLRQCPSATEVSRPDVDA
jgi:uncharacterized membrane protein